MTRRATRWTTSTSHTPTGRSTGWASALKPGLPDGTYTGTYRVISADTHIVYGGLVFNIGHAGAAPKFTVVGLIGRNKSGEVTLGGVWRRTLARLPLDRADARGVGVRARRVAARASSGVRIAAALGCSLAQLRQAPGSAPARRGRARHRRERARIPAPGRQRGWRLAVERTEKRSPHEHPSTAASARSGGGVRSTGC